MSYGIRKVERMTEPPATCTACGGNPLDIDGNAQWAIDLGTDINYGEHAYLCCECADIVGTVMDRPDAEEVEALIKSKELTEEKLEIAERLLEKYREKLDAIKIVKAPVGVEA